MCEILFLIFFHEKVLLCCGVYRQAHCSAKVGRNCQCWCRFVPGE